MHKISNRWQFGLFLSLVTVVLWGILPIALTGLLKYMDAITITWFRFAFAATFLLIFLRAKNKLSLFRIFKNKHALLLLIICIIGLLANYLLFMYGLAFTTPESAQITIQLAPMLLLIGGVVLFKESFNAKQFMGLVVFIIGLLLFFNQRLVTLFTLSGDYTWGIVLVIFSSILWAMYALAQKQLLKHMASEDIMVLIYIAGSIAFLPNAVPTLLFELDGFGWFLLLFCGLNTLIAYGAFAEALDHWEASRVSATLALTPLFTLLFMKLVSTIDPSYISMEPMNKLSIIGAITLVIGSVFTAISRKKIK